MLAFRGENIIEIKKKINIIIYITLICPKPGSFSKFSFSALTDL